MYIFCLTMRFSRRYGLDPSALSLLKLLSHDKQCPSSLGLALAKKLAKMAGAVGFEPTNAEIKTQCLAAWRRPSKVLVVI